VLELIKSLREELKEDFKVWTIDPLVIPQSGEPKTRPAWRFSASIVCSSTASDSDSASEQNEMSTESAENGDTTAAETEDNESPRSESPASLGEDIEEEVLDADNNLEYMPSV